MFGFAHPEFLFLLLAVPVVVWWWLRLRRPALRYSDTHPLLRLPAGRRRWARWMSAGLRTAALGLLVVAMAGPRWADAGEQLSTQGIAIEILVDVSGSMAEKDYEWEEGPGAPAVPNAPPAKKAVEKITRLEAVKRVFKLFVMGGEAPNGVRLEGRPNDLIGLTAFATLPKTVCSLTPDRRALLKILKAQKPSTIPDKSKTNIGDAIVWGVTDLENAPPQRKILVLFTDGEHNVEAPALKPRQAAQLAANKGIPIFAIDAGTDAGGGGAEGEAAARSLQDRQQAVKTLQSITKMTGGKYFQARDAARLLEVCQEIDRLNREQIESFQYLYYYEAFGWFALASFVLWWVVHFLEWTFWARVL
jgi:Ca-activated chloride channel family protein